MVLLVVAVVLMLKDPQFTGGISSGESRLDITAGGGVGGQSCGGRLVFEVLW